MIRSASRAFLLALPLAVLVAGCGSPTSPTVTTTTTTTTSTTTTTTTTTATVTYTGTLVANAKDTYVFAATPGSITVTMTALDPNTVLPAIGMGLGTWNGTACTLVVSTTAAQVNTQLVGTASLTSNFCVQVWDVNGFAPGYVQNYTVTATHYKVAGT